MTIGKRAAKLLRERAKKNGTTLAQEAENINASRQLFVNWEKRGVNPNAYLLQQMYFAGYDVIWILTGGKDGK